MTRERFMAAVRLFFILWGIVLIMAAMVFFLLLGKGCSRGPDA